MGGVRAAGDVASLLNERRAVSAARDNGNSRAALAIDVYTARIREAIGALSATMGGVDALTFADGVGENCPEIRACACLSFTLARR